MADGCRTTPSPPGGPLLIVTDLDGTLLDHWTYSFDAAREALDALRDRGCPLVLASSKTRAELERVASAIGQRCVLIVENGGALVVPADQLAGPPPGARLDDRHWVWELGLPRRELVVQLAAIAQETGTALRGFASMTVGEIAKRTGLPETVADLASQRAYDEPFLLDDPQGWPAVRAAAERRGLRVTRGGRFGHLVSAGTDKGVALQRLLDALAADGRRVTTVALGDAANDAGMLARADRPVLVPRPNGELDPDLRDQLPGAECAPLPGPAGWNAAVLAILAGSRLPRADGASR